MTSKIIIAPANKSLAARPVLLPTVEVADPGAPPKIACRLSGGPSDGETVMIRGDHYTLRRRGGAMRNGRLRTLQVAVYRRKAGENVLTFCGFETPQPIQR